MRKSALLLVFLSALSGQGIYLDGIYSLHSMNYRDGELISPTAVISHDLVLDMPEYHMWFDLHGLSELKASPAMDAELTLNYDFITERMTVSPFAGVFMTSSENPAAETGINADIDVFIPMAFHVKWKTGTGQLYLSADSYRKFDSFLPGYISLKTGSRLQSGSDPSLDIEAALSVYMTLGNIMLEPYLTMFVTEPGPDRGITLNFSLSKPLVEL